MQERCGYHPSVPALGDRFPREYSIRDSTLRCICHPLQLHHLLFRLGFDAAEMVDCRDIASCSLESQVIYQMLSPREFEVSGAASE